MKQIKLGILGILFITPLSALATQTYTLQPNLIGREFQLIPSISSNIILDVEPFKQSAGWFDVTCQLLSRNNTNLLFYNNTPYDHPQHTALPAVVKHHFDNPTIEFGGHITNYTQKSPDLQLTIQFYNSQKDSRQTIYCRQAPVTPPT